MVKIIACINGIYKGSYGLENSQNTQIGFEKLGVITEKEMERGDC